MAIFQDANGLPIKFFLQKDLPQLASQEVREMIAYLGGKVETKVPRVGYVLVQPGTPEEQRLRMCWASLDRPERFFVPYTFVDACKAQNTLIKQIFLLDGKPMGIHIHQSIANVNVRAALTQRILHSGGDPSVGQQQARVILADPNTEVFQSLVKTYQSESDKYIESYLWVKKCVDAGEVTYTPVVWKNPGGRRAGEERTHFTEEDEVNLCNWIAAKIPFKETGGRTGNRLYHQLVGMSDDIEYSWVTRHTWQSWRERYKKNAARLDIKISEIVERNKPNKGEKGQYGYVRKPEERPKRTKKKSIDCLQEEDGTTGEGPSAGPLDFISGPTLYPAPVGGNSTTEPISASFPIPPQSIHPNAAAAPQAGPAYPPEAITEEVLAARQVASEEEDDESEWQIREGNGSPPLWAKRKAPEEEEEGQSAPKKIKYDAASPSTKQAAETVPTRTSQQFTLLHVIDQAILAIASQFRFTVEEVKEYYDKCGDINRTTNRFRRMREVLNSLPDDDNVASLPSLPLIPPSSITSTAMAMDDTKSHSIPSSRNL